MKLLNPEAYKDALANGAWLKGTGKIIYDPYRPGLKKKKDWWAILEVDKETTRYYRYWIKQRYGIELCQPSWDAHVSIIRGEKPRAELMHLWKKYHNKTIEFKYQHFARFSGDLSTLKDPSKIGAFWFIDVQAPELTAIRDEFQLPSNWNQHLTVGRKW